uniref:Uncharacterized protein n=1 Tax=Arundo donax TaxID=35708 RepID=A0A0A9CCU9_ARUDO
MAVSFVTGTPGYPHSAYYVNPGSLGSDFRFALCNADLRTEKLLRTTRDVSRSPL